MRAAICLSGLVRTYRETYQNFLDSLITANPDYQIDIFISTWPTEHSNNSMERARRIAWNGADTPPFPEDHIDVKDLRQKYDPVSLVIEKPIEFVVPWYVETPGLHIQSIMNMIYKIHAVDLLRRQHERLFNFKYDVIVRTRFDTLIPTQIKFNDLPKDGLLLPSMMQPRWHPDYNWTNDKFAAGRNDLMEVYCDWFLYLEEMVVGRKIPIQPEILLCDHLRHNQVNQYEMGAEFDLVRPAGF